MKCYKLGTDTQLYISLKLNKNVNAVDVLIAKYYLYISLKLNKNPIEIAPNFNIVDFTFLLS